MDGSSDSIETENNRGVESEDCEGGTGVHCELASGCDWRRLEPTVSYTDTSNGLTELLIKSDVEGGTSVYIAGMRRGR